MTMLKMKDGEVVYTDLTASEVRSCLQGGNRDNVVKGYTKDSNGNKEYDIYINCHSVLYVVIQ